MWMGALPFLSLTFSYRAKVSRRLKLFCIIFCIPIHLRGGKSLQKASKICISEPVACESDI